MSDRRGAALSEQRAAGRKTGAYLCRTAGRTDASADGRTTRTHMHSGGPRLFLRDAIINSRRAKSRQRLKFPLASLFLPLLRLSSGWVPQPKVISGRGATASHHGTGRGKEGGRIEQHVSRSYVRSFPRLCRRRRHRHRPRRRCRETKIHQLLNSGRTNQPRRPPRPPFVSPPRRSRSNNQTWRRKQ